MKAVPTWLYYSVYRVLMFIVPLVVLLLLGIEPWLSTLLAAIIGFCLSYIFLRHPREAISRDLYRARHRPAEPLQPDEESEDAAGDRLERERRRSEREGQGEHDPVAKPGEAGEFEGKNQLP